MKYALLITVLSALIACSTEQQESALPLTQEDVEAAYVWGLPIVAMYRYTVSMGQRVDGINQVFHNRELFEPGVLPGGANNDTLYSFGWFDLRDEPYVVSLPNFQDRYFVWQMTDMYSHNFANVGSDLLGKPTNEGNYSFLMVGPEWDGQVPQGMEVVRAPVDIVNVLYRIQVEDEPRDIAAANRLQNLTATMPLSAYREGSEETVRVMPSEPWIEYREALTFAQGVAGNDQRSPAFFSVLHDAIRMNPAYTTWDQGMIAGTLAKLGVGSEAGFNFAALDEQTQSLILDAQAAAFDKVMALKESGYGPKHAGWQYGPSNHGDWGDDYLRRAYATFMGGMWPKPENSTYALAYHDVEGRILEGAQEYRLTFSREEIPPATKFWSVTAYEAGTFDLYPNEDEKHVVGSNHPSTVFGEDGSIEIVFSNTRPDLETSNWLPIPKGEFFVAVRFYAPTPEVLDLTYKIPGIEVISEANLMPVPG